jgi:hypothetical protein
MSNANEWQLPESGTPCCDPDSQSRRWNEEEIEQTVIVVPNHIAIDESNHATITMKNAHFCRVITLGKTMAVDVGEMSEEGHHQYLVDMIAAGVRAIHQEQLAETNAKFLEKYPTAEGSRSRRAKAFNEWEAPWKLSIPANTVGTFDIPWPADAKEVAAKIEPMDDEGLAWGLGIAAGWPDGQYIQINVRADGRWGIRHNRDGYLCGSYSKGKAAILVIDLSHRIVSLKAEVDRLTPLRTIAEFSRLRFLGAPSVVRVGKIGETWEPRDAADPGKTHPCRVAWVRIY